MIKLNARNTDPISSNLAGEAIERSGKADRQRHIALNAVKKHPGLTSRELAVETGLDRYMLARRLPELVGVKQGPMRMCRFSTCRKPCVTWIVREKV